MSLRDGAGDIRHTNSVHQENLRGKNELTNRNEAESKKRRALASISDNSILRGGKQLDQRSLETNAHHEGDQVADIEFCSKPTYLQPIYAPDSALCDLPEDQPVNFFSNLMQHATHSSIYLTLTTSKDLSILFQSEAQNRAADPQVSHVSADESFEDEEMPIRMEKTHQTLLQKGFARSLSLKRARTQSGEYAFESDGNSRISLDRRPIGPSIVGERSEFDDSCISNQIKMKTPNLEGIYTTGANVLHTLPTYGMGFSVSDFHFAPSLAECFSFDIPGYSTHKDEEFFSVSLCPEYVSLSNNPIELLLSALE